MVHMHTELRFLRAVAFLTPELFFGASTATLPSLNCVDLSAVMESNSMQGGLS